MRETRPHYALALHGGAGDYDNAGFTPDQIAAYRASLRGAAMEGEGVLKAGGTAIDAVCAAIAKLEDDPLFNAGHGAVLTDEGKVELDAALMNGCTKQAGSVAGVRTTQNPIHLAKTVMNHSAHVILHGRGADAFAALHHLPQVDNDHFITPFRRKQWEAARALGGPIQLGKFGTVGAVALDQDGSLAAGTSTGGLTNKQFGRVGDSPIIGAGTYASNEGCAVSCTGHGEFFIRLTLARDVSALMELSHLPLEAAANLMIEERLRSLGGEGGLIAIDREGHVAMPFNTSGMFRACVRAGEDIQVGVFKSDLIG